MKGSSRRPEQVGETLRQVISDALLGEVRDPRVGPGDGDRRAGHQRPVACAGPGERPGEEADKLRALEGLQSAAGFLRSRAARTLTTRSVPELHFELDRGLEHAARISELLNTIRREEQD